MKKMIINNDLLTAVFSVEAESYDCTAQAENVAGICSARGYEVTTDEAGNVLATKGTAAVMPCLVAHLDTVHDITGQLVLQTMGDKLYAMDSKECVQLGVGGDDKCGVYAALAVADMLPACRLAFFVDEEVGCLGSREVDVDFFKGSAFVLQADRRGSRDFVTSINGVLSSDAFQKACKQHLKRHGYTPCAGAMTDVESLRDRGVNVSVANMSAGYFNPHSSREWVSLKALNNCASLMLDMCRDMGRKVWEFVPAPKPVYVRPAEDKGRSGAAWQREDAAAWAKYYGGKSRPAGVSRLQWEAEQDEQREEFPGWQGGKYWPLD